MARHCKLCDFVFTLWVVLAVYTLHRQVSFYARGTFLKNTVLIEHKIPIYNSVFPGD
jgi:hypothetical protein